MKRKHYKRLTEKDFTMLKGLLDAGVSQRKIIELTGRGSGTLSFIKNSNSLKEYQEKLRFYRKSLEDKKEDEKSPSVEDLIKVATPNSQHDELIGILTQINNSINRLVMAWENKPKKGIFG